MKSKIKEQFITNAKGHKRAVDLMEDVTDLRVIAERKNNPKYSLQGFLDRNQLALPKKKVSKTLVNIRNKIKVLGLTEKDINTAIKRVRSKKRR